MLRRTLVSLKPSPSRLLTQRNFSTTFQAMAPTQMRAVKIKGDKGPASALYIGEVDKPVPQPGQVLVKIRSFGLNRMDLLQREGKYPLPPQAGPILGVEFSGVVEEDGVPKQGGGEVGEKAGIYKKGDEVFGLAYGGAYAEYIAVNGGMLMRKPAHLSHQECASIPENFLTAYQALKLVGNMQKGESVLVHAGAGGVGVAANQLARVFGAEKVFTTAGSNEKLEFLKSLPDGPTSGINYKTQDFAAVIKEETGGKGVDVILDFIGKDYFHQNISSLAISGRLVFLAFMSGPKVGDFDLSQILFKRLSIQGTTLRARDEAYQTNLLSRFESEAMGRVRKGDIEVRIHKEFDWEQVREAHEMMEANANSGKIILNIS